MWSVDLQDFPAENDLCLLTRQAGSVPSLQSLSRDAVLLILSTNNRQERLVRPLVDRLGQNITRQAREICIKL